MVLEIFEFCRSLLVVRQDGRVHQNLATLIIEINLVRDGESIAPECNSQVDVKSRIVRGDSNSIKQIEQLILLKFGS